MFVPEEIPPPIRSLEALIRREEDIQNKQVNREKASETIQTKHTQERRTGSHFSKNFGEHRHVLSPTNNPSLHPITLSHLVPLALPSLPKDQLPTAVNPSALHESLPAVPSWLHAPLGEASASLLSLLSSSIHRVQPPNSTKSESVGATVDRTFSLTAHINYSNSDHTDTSSVFGSSNGRNRVVEGEVARPRPCFCRKSQCLKLYCECYAADLVCVPITHSATQFSLLLHRRVTMDVCALVARMSLWKIMTESGYHSPLPRPFLFYSHTSSLY
jgi:hypothetical protein